MYPLMGYVCYRIVNQKDRKRTAALSIYVLQLVFNVLWMPMMFEGWFMISAIWLFVLVCLIAILIMFTWKIRKGAALLLLPYLVLCLIALFFNGHIALE
jgi:tryptophan-rich sensory protein